LSFESQELDGHKRLRGLRDLCGSLHRFANCSRGSRKSRPPAGSTATRLWKTRQSGLVQTQPLW